MAETRTLFVRGHPTLPDDEYALIEAYCPDPRCDCRRVMLNLAGRSRMAQGYLAAIGFGFDRKEPMAGPYLDPLNRQSQYADALFDLVVQVLSDPAYVRRLERHYARVKRAASDNTDPAHQALLRLLADDRVEPRPSAPLSPAQDAVQWQRSGAPRAQRSPGRRKRRKR